MLKEIILIQHTDTTKPGTVLPWLEKRGSFRHLKMQNGDALPEIEKGQGVILCGGSPHVDQEDIYPWLKAEKKFLESQIKIGNKIMGLCLGGQLCAQVLGAPVYPHERGWEIGWWDVELLPTKSLTGFESKKKITVSQHHRYVFEAPKESQIVATNSWWTTQGFLWNEQVLGFQFHPERDLPGNKVSSKEEGSSVDGQTQNASEIVALGTLHQPEVALWFKGVLDGFFR